MSSTLTPRKPARMLRQALEEKFRAEAEVRAAVLATPAGKEAAEIARQVAELRGRLLRFAGRRLPRGMPMAVRRPLERAKSDCRSLALSVGAAADLLEAEVGP